MPRELDLSHHGELVALYEGDGVLTTDVGRHLDCTFKCGQRKDGGLVLALHIDGLVTLGAFSAGFEGRDTRTGVRLTVPAIMTSDSGSFTAGQHGTYSQRIFEPRRLVATVDETGRPAVIRFSITNYEFWSIERTREGRVSQAFELNGLRVSIEQVDDYKHVANRMNTLRNVEVTAEVAVPCRPGHDDEAYETIVDDLCQVLSVALGTRVQWIMSRTEADDGVLLKASHYHRFTAGYTHGPLFNPTPTDCDDLRRFVEMAYRRLVAMKESHGLGRGLIDAYIEAKAAGDFIERRGVKLAVAVEMFKDAFLRLAEPPATEFILAEKHFGALRKKIKKALVDILEQSGVSGHDAQSMCEKLGELNRTSFATVLHAICDKIDLKVSESEIRLFIRCRNELVHTGRIYRPTPAEMPLLFNKPDLLFGTRTLDVGDENVAVFLFMEHFVDKLFLKLLGYSGSFRDSRLVAPGIMQFGNPVVLR